MTSVEPVERAEAPLTTPRATLIEKGFHPPSPEVFRPRRERWLHPAAFGFSRLALQLSAFLLGGLAILLVATLWIADLRQGAIDTVMNSLAIQSDAVAAAFALARSPETGTLLVRRLDPSAAPANGAAATAVQPRAPTDMRVDRAELEALLARIMEGAPARVRTYDLDGRRVTDSAIALLNLPATAQLPAKGEFGDSILFPVWRWVSRVFLAPGLQPEPEDGAPTAARPEIADAIGGMKQAALRATRDGDILISVATPIRDPSGEVVGALHLRSGPGMVTEMARAQGLAITKVFLVAAVFAVLLSLFVAATVTRPISRLASAAERIRRGGAATPIPELRDAGQIGELSRILHDMTVALYQRIDAIEAFAAEVAHELKNPLTSLRSAVETLPLARSDGARERLMEVIQHDVRRIDRLITDISDASKLDAELNRHHYERFDLIRMLRAVVGAQSEIALDRAQSVELVVRGDPDPSAYLVMGNDGRLSQVFTNLIDNARSFTPDGGRVVTTAQRFTNFIEVVVDDEGPGIAEEALERIFERFYTDRSEQRSFGNNSGLGLAICRQIVEAHSGEIFAENRYRTTLGPGRDVAGARFTVRLPVAS